MQTNPRKKFFFYSNEAYLILHCVNTYICNNQNSQNNLFIVKYNSDTSCRKGEFVDKIKFRCMIEFTFIIPVRITIRKLSPRQRRLCVEIVDYSWFSLELPMKWENWELAIIDHPRIFLYWKMQLRTTMAIIAIYKCTLRDHENHRNSNCFRW